MKKTIILLSILILSTSVFAYKATPIPSLTVAHPSPTNPTQEPGAQSSPELTSVENGPQSHRSSLTSTELAGFLKGGRVYDFEKKIWFIRKWTDAQQARIIESWKAHRAK